MVATANMVRTRHDVVLIAGRCAMLLTPETICNFMIKQYIICKCVLAIITDKTCAIGVIFLGHFTNKWHIVTG